MTRLLWVEIPMRLPSTANLREHWSAKAKRAKAQRNAVAMALKSHNLRQGVLDGIAEQTRGGQLLVRFTRISPRKLDSDNLAIAFKHCRDQVAEHFGTDDGSEQWDWSYRQEPGRPAIRIEVRRIREGRNIFDAGEAPNRFVVDLTTGRIAVT